MMGKYDVGAEEEEIRKVLAGEQSLEAAIGEPDEAVARDPIAAMLARIATLPASAPGASDGATPAGGAAGDGADAGDLDGGTDHLPDGGR